MAIALNNHQVVRSTANTDSYTLSSYAVPSGNDRVLVVMISGMRSNDTANIVLSGVTFGAASLTEAVSITDTSTSRYYYTGIWYLVNPAVSTANISFTVNSGNLIGAIISAATLTGVDQTTPIAGYTSVSTTGAGIAFDPVDSGGDATWVGHRGDMALAAVSASANNNPTWDWDNGDLYDLNNGTSSNSEIAGSGAAYASYPIVACSISPSRTVGVAVGFNEAAGDEIATSAASSATSTAVSTPRLAAKVAAASLATSTASASASVLRSTTAASAATSAASAVPTVPAGPNETLLTGLEAWYSLDESSGTRVDAHSGNDLTDINTVGSTTGKVGNAALFARASNERLERSSAFLAPSAGFTISGWLYKTADNAMTIASQWNEDGVNQRGWRLYSSAGTNLRLQTSRDGTFGTTAEVNTTISNSAWYWFCAWFDPATDIIAISLNNGTPVTATQTDVYTSPAKFVMGAIETSTGGTQHWDGRLDEIAVWDRVLTSDERTWLYNGGSGRAYSDLGNGSVVNTSGSTSASSVASASPSVTRQGAASASASSSASGAPSVTRLLSASLSSTSTVEALPSRALTSLASTAASSSAAATASILPPESGNWWEPTTGSFTCVAAYQAKGAASLAASYVNLANPGVNDAAPGIAPYWSAGTGWTFNGISQYLIATGLVPANGWSAVVRLSGNNPADRITRTIFGCRGDPRFYINASNSPLTAFNYGSIPTYAGNMASAGVFAITPTGYAIDGVWTGWSTSWTGSLSGQLFGIGGMGRIGGVVNNFYAGNMQALAVYSTPLDAAQVAEISAAMAALTDADEELSATLAATSSVSAAPSVVREASGALSATSSAVASLSVIKNVTASSAATSSVNGVATVYGASTVAGESTAQSGASASPSLLRAVTGEAEATSTTAVSPSLATGVSGASSATSSATGVTEVSRLTSGSLSVTSTAAAYPYSESEAYVRGETGAVSGASASVSLSLPVAGSLAAASNAAAASMATSPAAGSTQAVSGASGVASVTRGVSAEAGATSGADAASSMAVGVSGTLDASSAASADAMMAWFTGGSVSAQSGAESLLRSLLLTAAASGASSDAMAIAIVMAAPLVIYRGTVYGAGKSGVVNGVKKRGIVLSSGDLDYSSEV